MPTELSNPASLPTLRTQARELLNEFDAADGLACYYTLHHDAKRSTLAVHRDSAGLVDGFLAHCMTGFDLFRPLVTMRVRGSNDPVPALIETALKPGRPYLLVVPESLFDRVEPLVEVADPVRTQVMRLDPSRFHPDMNVMVVTRPDRDGNPRAEVRQGDTAAAVAGVNWVSPIFAEVFVQVQPDSRKRGWGRAVVRALCAELLKRQVTPLYSVAEDNDDSFTLADDVGFVETGAREVMASITGR